MPKRMTISIFLLVLVTTGVGCKSSSSLQVSDNQVVTDSNIASQESDVTNYNENGLRKIETINSKTNALPERPEGYSATISFSRYITEKEFIALSETYQLSNFGKAGIKVYDMVKTTSPEIPTVSLPVSDFLRITHLDMSSTMESFLRPETYGEYRKFYFDLLEQDGVYFAFVSVYGQDINTLKQMLANEPLVRIVFVDLTTPKYPGGGEWPEMYSNVRPIPNPLESIKRLCPMFSNKPIESLPFFVSECLTPIPTTSSSTN